MAPLKPQSYASLPADGSRGEPHKAGGMKKDTRKKKKKQAGNHCTNHLKLSQNEYQNAYRETIKLGNAANTQRWHPSEGS